MTTVSFQLILIRVVKITHVKRQRNKFFFDILYEELITIDLPDDHCLVTQHANLEKAHFDESHTVKRLIASFSIQATTPGKPEGSATPGFVYDIPGFLQYSYIPTCIPGFLYS